MRGIISTVIITFVLTVYPVNAQSSAKVDSHNPKLFVSASQGVYNGRKCLVLELREGQVPVNAPAERLKLLSDQNNEFKSFQLKQISPGRFVTMDDIVIDSSYFKLKFLNSTRFQDVEISFKNEKK
ncbi:MAG: hypothetical protein AB1782_11165 [Cyanobacteriota bacterium]